MFKRGSIFAFIMLIGQLATGCAKIRHVDLLSAILDVIDGCNSFTMEGSGTPTDRYKVCTVSQLRDLDGAAPGVEFQLGRDIDLKDEAPFAPISGFQGKLYGEGHSIKNHHYTDPTSDRIGLFDSLDSGVEIHDLTLDSSVLEGHDEVAALAAEIVHTGMDLVKIDNVTVVNAAVSGHKYISALVGLGSQVEVTALNISDAKVIGVMSSGLVAGATSNGFSLDGAVVTGLLNASMSSGGVVGYALNSGFKNFAFMGSVTVDPFTKQNAAAGDDSNTIGGMIGYAENCDIADSYGYVNVTATTDYMYGLGVFAAEVFNSRIDNIYVMSSNTTDYQGNSDDVEFFPYDDGFNNFHNAYYYKHANSPDDSTGNFTPYTALADFADDTNFSFDYTNTWEISSSAPKVPVLKNVQSTSAPFGSSGYDVESRGGLFITETENATTGLAFPDVNIGSFDYATLTVRNNTGHTLYVKDLYPALNSSFLLATGFYAGTCVLYVTTGLPLYDGQTCTVGVRFDPSNLVATAVVSDAFVVKYAMDSSSGNIGYVSHAVDGKAVMINPYIADDSIDHGNVVAGSATSDLDFTLENTGTEDLEIVSYTLPAGDVTLDDTDCPVGTPLIPAATCDLHFHYAPGVISSYSENLEVKYKNPYSGDVFTMYLSITGEGVAPPFSCGSGTALDPYCVTSAADLVTIRDSFATTHEYFQMQNNIDMGAGCVAPFYRMTNFNGHFDGAGYTIENLCTHHGVGFINILNDGGEIHDVNFNHLEVDDSAGISTIVGYSSVVAGVVGWVVNGTLDHVHADGHVVASSGTPGAVGGLVGILSYAGQAGSISNSDSAMDVTGVDYTGGLVGVALENAGIDHSFATENVTGTASRIGGLVGAAIGSVTIDTCYVSNGVDVIAASASYVGGLVGVIDDNVLVTKSYSRATTVSGANFVGGLVGMSDGNGGANGISKSFSLNNVVSGTTNVGGLVGRGSSELIMQCYSKGGTISATDYNAGGLVGGSYGGTIHQTFANNTVNGGSMDAGGGLVGYESLSQITESFAFGDVTGVAAGGLVGVSNDGTINDCFSIAAVHGPGGFGMAGGLIGRVQAMTALSRVHSIGTVDNVGGGSNSSFGSGAATGSDLFYYAYPGHPGDIQTSGLNDAVGQELNVLANFTNFSAATWVISLNNPGTLSPSPVPVLKWACDPVAANGVAGDSWTNITNISCP